MFIVNSEISYTINKGKGKNQSGILTAEDAENVEIDVLGSLFFRVFRVFRGFIFCFIV